VTTPGRRFVRRVRTTDAQSLTVAQIKALFPPELEAKLEQLTLYFHYGSARLTISKNPPGFPVRFDVTQQAKGRRHWFVCVGCWRRAGKLYMVKTNEGVIWGCQRCLGLSYPSQAQHKTPARDMAITGGDIQVSFREELRAHHRQRRRLMKLSASADRFFKKRL
jgi:hypothetical protein